MPKAVKTVYIAGPMRGIEGFNYPMFHEVSAYIRDCGLGNEADDKPTVLNPAENFSGKTTLPYEQYMDADLRQVLSSDALILLPGWRTSEGTGVEITVALATGKRFFQALAVNAAKRTWRFEEIAPDLVRVQTGQEVEPVSDEPETIEQEAGRLVRSGPRQQTYGHPRGDFDRVAAMWSAILETQVTAEQVAIMMIAFKLARLSQTPYHRDSQVDVIGYTVCLDRLNEPA